MAMFEPHFNRHVWIKKFEELRARMSRKQREEAEAVAAQLRLNDGCIAEEEERLGKFIDTSEERVDAGPIPPPGYICFDPECPFCKRFRIA